MTPLACARRYAGSVSMRSQLAVGRFSASCAEVVMTSSRAVASRTACRPHAWMRPARAWRDACLMLSGFDAGASAGASGTWLSAGSVRRYAGACRQAGPGCAAACASCDVASSTVRPTYSGRCAAAAPLHGSSAAVARTRRSADGGVGRS